MKRNLVCFCAVVLMVVAMTGRATSQSGCYSFSSDVGSYIDESTDGTYIYTSVEVDGSEDMTIYPQCSSYPEFQHIQHTPSAYNQLTPSGGSSVGGWSSGPAVCPSCYLSYTNDQSVPFTQGVDCSFEYETQATCNVGGTFVDSGASTISLAPAVTVGQEVACNPTSYIGKYVPACSSGTATCPNYTPQTWYIQFDQNEVCWAYARTPWIAVYTNGTLSECVQPFLSLQASGPGTCF